MLRVRPIHFTSRVAAFLPIFDLLGLVHSNLVHSNPVRSNQESDWYEFAAGSGRLALRRAPAGSTEDGVTRMGFEARDLDTFTARTVQDGTCAEIVEVAHGSAARVTGRDGLQFLVDRTEQLEPNPDADARLSVTMIWLSPDVAGVSHDLRNIGALPQPGAENEHGQVTDFRAKNGGKVTVHPATSPAHGPLGFGYDGNVEELLGRFLDAGIAAHLIDETYGRTLHVVNPDFADLPGNPTGPTLWINEEVSNDLA